MNSEFRYLRISTNFFDHSDCFDKKDSITNRHILLCLNFFQNKISEFVVGSAEQHLHYIAKLHTPVLFLGDNNHTTIMRT